MTAFVLCAGCLCGLATRPVAAATANSSLVVGSAPMTATSAATAQPQWIITQTVQLLPAPVRSQRPIPPAPDPVCAENIAAVGSAATGLLAFVSGQTDSRVIPALPIACGARSGWALPAPRVARTHLSRSGAAPSRGTALHLPAYVPIGAASSDTLDLGSYISMAIKFAIVMVLIFVCLRVLRAVLPRLQGRSLASGGGTLLHSESVGAKQTVQVIDLGVRVIVVGVTPTAMTSLATIEGQEEIEAIRAYYRAPLKLLADDADGEEGGTRLSFARALSATMSKRALSGAISARARGGRKQDAEADADDDAEGDEPDDDADDAGERDPILDRALSAMRTLRSRTQRS